MAVRAQKNWHANLCDKHIEALSRYVDNSHYFLFSDTMFGWIFLFDVFFKVVK